MNKNERFQSDVTFEELEIGKEFLFAATNQVSEVTNLTSNSVEMFNKTDPNNTYKSGQKDANGEIQSTGKRKGIDGKNWYEMSQFNRTFKRL